MIPYADSNFFTRLYFEQVHGSLDALALAGRVQQEAAPLLPITRIHRLEVINAFDLHVFQSRFLGQTRITREYASMAQATFREDCASNKVFRVCNLSDADVDRQFEDLVLRHTASRGFRTYDLLHVSQALVLGCDTFWSFDEKANSLAELEGLEIRKTPAQS